MSKWKRLIFDDDFPTHHVPRLWTSVPIGIVFAAALLYVLSHFA